MTLPTLAIVLAAATIHAFWNMLIARARDTQATLAVAIAIGVVVGTSIEQAAGVGLVGLGVVLVRGLRGGVRLSDVALALTVAVSIAGYTLVDKQGVQYADPVTYVTLILIVPAIVSVLFVASRGGVARVRDAVALSSIVGGVASISAYGLVLVALTMAAAASVAATREVSVVIAAILGAVVLHERVGPARLAGSVVVALGVALVVAG
jgi:drug/metabolite transporter (DMT)-like permease